MRSPPGIHVLSGVPLGCGWRPNDVIVDWVAHGSLLFTYGRVEGDTTIDLDSVDWSLSFRGRQGRKPLPAGKSQLAPGLFVRVVDAPPLIVEPRRLHGRWVVGPRAVSLMYGVLKVTWDVVDGSVHRRLAVESRGDGADTAHEYVLEPRGLDIDQLGPTVAYDKDGEWFLETGPYGPVSAEASKRLALELADQKVFSAWIGWDGVVRKIVSPQGAVRTQREWFARLHAAFHFDERFGRAPAYVERAFEESEPASSEHLAALVKNLRPEWTAVRTQYQEELAILAGTLKD
jgi:hypothetical protein